MLITKIVEGVMARCGRCNAAESMWEFKKCPRCNYPDREKRTKEEVVKWLTGMIRDELDGMDDEDERVEDIKHMLREIDIEMEQK